jgi:hypothetical protein
MDSWFQKALKEMKAQYLHPICLLSLEDMSSLVNMKLFMHESSVPSFSTRKLLALFPMWLGASRLASD